MSSQSTEVCFEGGGRVRIWPIPHDRPEWPEAPRIGCPGCRREIRGGEGFFMEIDGRDWGVGLQIVCGSCMAEALRPRNVIRANETEASACGVGGDRRGRGIAVASEQRSEKCTCGITTAIWCPVHRDKVVKR